MDTYFFTQCYVFMHNRKIFKDKQSGLPIITIMYLFHILHFQDLKNNSKCIVT